MNDRMSNDDPIETTTQSGPNPDQPSWPGFVPFARPVTIDAVAPPQLAVGDSWPPAMSRLRAMIELIILVPAGLLGLLVVAGPFSIMPLNDNRWFAVFSSVGLGAGTLTACAIMLLVARQKPAAIGWTRRTLVFNAGLGVAGMIAAFACRFAILLPLSLIFPQILREAETAQNAIEQMFPPMSFIWIALVMTFVVIWEEVVFRGFLLTRLQAIFRRWWLTILVGSLIFGASHGYQGYLAMSMITSLALIMSLLFVWRRSLVPSMVLHWLHNVGVLLLLRAISSTWH